MGRGVMIPKEITECLKRAKISKWELELERRSPNLLTFPAGPEVQFLISAPSKRSLGPQAVSFRSFPT